MRFHCSRAREGFTLVELLIVVLILGILAGVVIPQFANSTQDARIASLDTTLGSMRGAIDLYLQEHGEYPSANGDGVNLADTSAAFLTQLTQYTDLNGDVQLTTDATHIFGPYLKKAVMPTEPITQLAVLEVITTGALGMVATVADPGGWKFDNVTGQFIVNDAAWDDR